MRRALLALLFASTLLDSTSVRAADELNSLIGVFTEVPASSKWKGAQVTFTGLASAQPSVVWPDGYDNRLTPIFENDSLLVLQFVGTAGSTDTAYIEKKNKRFTVVSVGAMAIPVGGPNTASVSVYRGAIK